MGPDSYCTILKDTIHILYCHTILLIKEVDPVQTCIRLQGLFFPMDYDVTSEMQLTDEPQKYRNQSCQNGQLLKYSKFCAYYYLHSYGWKEEGQTNSLDANSIEFCLPNTKSRLSQTCSSLIAKQNQKYKRPLQEKIVSWELT